MHIFLGSPSRRDRGVECTPKQLVKGVLRGFRGHPVLAQRRQCQDGRRKRYSYLEIRSVTAIPDGTRTRISSTAGEEMPRVQLVTTTVRTLGRETGAPSHPSMRRASLAFLEYPPSVAPTLAWRPKYTINSRYSNGVFEKPVPRFGI
jgi:hypothetical protein